MDEKSRGDSKMKLMKRRSGFIVVALAFASVFSLLSASPASAASGTVFNRAHSLCLDADANGIHGNGDRIQLWGCTNRQNQIWSLQQCRTLTSSGVSGNYCEIVNTAAGKCLDADARHIGNGDTVALWDCRGGANQLWAPYCSPDHNAWYWYLDAGNHLVLDADARGSGNNGDRVQTWTIPPAHNGHNQQWYGMGTSAPMC